MDIVSVFLLMLVLPHHTRSICSSTCPAGYYKIGHCKDDNTRIKCLRCDRCSHNEVVVKPCNSTSNVECNCKNNYYKVIQGYCKLCVIQNFNTESANVDYMKKCQPCQRKECLSVPQCKRKCAESTDSLSTTSIMSTTSPTSPTSPTTTTTATTLWNSTSKDGVASPARSAPWLSLWVVLVVTVLLSMLLLLHLIRSKTRKPNVPGWRANKGVEPPAKGATSMDEASHRVSSMATLTFNITEETPLTDLNHCPALPQHLAAHISPLLPNAETKAVRQEELSGHWPPIVLYAIIKEVPLRRWKEFLRLLSVDDQQLERVELEAGLGSMEKQYQILKLWSQRSSASLADVFSALHYMDLSGCAQLLQEHLEKLRWTSEPKYVFTA